MVTKLVCRATRSARLSGDAIRSLSFSPFSASYANFTPSSLFSSLSLTINDNIRSLNRHRPRASAAILTFIAEDEKRWVKVRSARYMQIFQACTWVVLSDFYVTRDTRRSCIKLTSDIIAQYLMREILYMIPMCTLGRKSHAVTDVSLITQFIYLLKKFATRLCDMFYTLLEEFLIIVFMHFSFLICLNVG